MYTGSKKTEKRIALPTFTNPRMHGMCCIRCSEPYSIKDHFEGCPRCCREGIPASLAIAYDWSDLKREQFCAGDWVAYPGEPLLGEGSTPLVDLPQLAEDLGITGLRIKNEGANPTGSHKDRMSAAVVRRALDVDRCTLVAASSGNAGVSLAAYCAATGLDCVVVSTRDILPAWRRAIDLHGARLVEADTVAERWALVSEKARAGKWYPVTNYLTPPVGGNPFAVDALRMVAFEIAAQAEGKLPTDVVVPTSRADLLWGIACGFDDLFNAGVIDHKPRVHAVEPFARLSAVMDGTATTDMYDGDTRLISIGGNTVTFQGVDALRRCGGLAVAVNDVDAMADQRLLARHGLYFENSSAAPLTALRKLVAQGVFASASEVVLVATSHGYKECGGSADTGAGR